MVVDTRVVVDSSPIFVLMVAASLFSYFVGEEGCDSRHRSRWRWNARLSPPSLLSIVLHLPKLC